VLPSAMIAVRDKSVGKHDRRDAQRTQDHVRKNTHAALGNIKKRDLFSGAGFQTKILTLDASRLEPLFEPLSRLLNHLPSKPSPPCGGLAFQALAAALLFAAQSSMCPSMTSSNQEFGPLSLPLILKGGGNRFFRIRR